MRVISQGLKENTGGLGEQAYSFRAMGEGAIFRERKRFRVSCTECGVTAKQSYLKQYTDSLDGICVPQTRGVNEKGEGPTTYVVSIPRILQLVRCLVLRCPAIAHSAGRMQENFMF